MKRRLGGEGMTRREGIPQPYIEKGDAKGGARSFLLRVGGAVSIAACLPQMIATTWWRSAHP